MADSSTSDQQNSGLLSNLNNALASYGGLMGLGNALMANSGGTPYRKSFGQVFGQSAIEAQQLAQQNALQQLQIQQGQLSVSSAQQKQKALAPFLGGQQSQDQPPQGAPQQGQGLMGSPQMGQPQGQPSMGGQPQQSQQPQQPQQPSGDLSQIPINGMDPNMYRRLAILQGKDPLETDKEIRALQLQTVQQAVSTKLQPLDEVVKAPDSAKIVSSNPQLQQIWQQTAPALGMDPVKDFTDANVRVAFNMAGNQIRSQAQLPTQAPPVALRTSTDKYGRTVQTDPITDKRSIEAAPSLEKIVGPDGKPTLVPSAQAVGKIPYNQLSTATDDDLQSTADQVANYKVAPPTGSKLLSGNWPTVMKMVKQINPDYDATQYGAKVKARNAFATGKQGDITRSLSVATDHLDQLSQAADALKNGGLPAANKVANFFSQQTGNASVTNFNAMKEIVGDEVVKAVVGSTGAAGDREAIKKSFSDAGSPAQLQGVIQKYKGLMGGQLKGLRQQYEKSTGLKDFDEMVSSNAQEQLGATHPADIQSLLDKYK